MAACGLHVRRDVACVTWDEAAWSLDLSRDEHLRHVVRDLEIVEARAREFSAAVARRPLLSDSTDARAGVLTAPRRARAWCAAVLTDRVAAAHTLSPRDLQQLAAASSHTSGATGAAHAAARE